MDLFGKMLPFYFNGLRRNVPSYAKRKNPKKPCVNCGKSHRHNNDSCSADCHRKFHATYKAQGGYNVLR